MTPNLDMEIVVLRSVLANATERHQFKAALGHAIELLQTIAAKRAVIECQAGPAPDTP